MFIQGLDEQVICLLHSVGMYHTMHQYMLDFGQTYAPGPAAERDGPDTIRTASGLACSPPPRSAEEMKARDCMELGVALCRLVARKYAEACDGTPPRWEDFVTRLEADSPWLPAVLNLLLLAREPVHHAGGLIPALIASPDDPRSACLKAGVKPAEHAHRIDLGALSRSLFVYFISRPFDD